MTASMTRDRLLFRIVIAVVLASGAAIPAHAQIWYDVPHHPGSHDVPNDTLGVYADGSTIYAATDSGGLIVFTNNGTNWTTYTTVSGLASNSVRGVYAAGSTIYAATGGGLSVSVQAVPEPSTYTIAIAGIACGGFSMWRRRKRA